MATAYISTVFLFEADAETLARQHATEIQLKLITLAVMIPVVLIWFAGFVGLINLQKYAAKIKGSRDGVGFMYLAAGVTVFAITVVINSLVSRVLKYAAAQHAIPDVASVIFDMEFATLANLVSFTLIFLGSVRLVQTLKKQVKTSHMVVVALVLAAISATYAVAVMVDPSRGLARLVGDNISYGIPDWFIVMTVVVPYILTWGFGLFATLFLYTYNKNVKGTIYKRALSRLTKGFFIILLMTVVLQFLYAASAMLTTWGLGALLSLVSVLLIIIAVGFLYIARGAKNLTKIEEAMS